MLEFYILPQIKEKILTEVKEGSILKAELSFAREKSIFLMISFDLIYRECPLIG